MGIKIKIVENSGNEFDTKSVKLRYWTTPIPINAPVKNTNPNTII